MQNEYNMSRVYSTLRWLANGIVTEYQNKSLSSELESKVDKFYYTLQGIIDWEDLTRDNLLELGFMTLADYDDEWEVWLIPAWLYPIIPDGLKVATSDLREFIFRRSECPFEVYYGALTFGLKLKNPLYGQTLEDLLKE